MEVENYFETEHSPRGAHFKHIKIMFDGSCGPVNPNGNLGFGYALFDVETNDIIAEGWGYRLFQKRWVNSSNVAEWWSLNRGLNILVKSGYTYDELTIEGDSKLVINQILGHWSIKGGYYVDAAESTLREFKHIIDSANIGHVYREHNDYCDYLSNLYIPHCMNQYGLDTGGEFKKDESKKKKKGGRKSTKRRRVDRKGVLYVQRGPKAPGELR